MKDKPQIIFVFHHCLGGVSSFNYNIINHSKLINKFYSKVILLDEREESCEIFKDNFHVDEVITFKYSRLDNMYHVHKRLNKLLGSAPGAIVTEESMAVRAAARFHNPKTVYYMLHDYAFVNGAVSLGWMIDVCIAHSSFFMDAIYASTEVFSGRVFHIPYGVQQIRLMPEKGNRILNLVYLGRLVEQKGVLLLHEIDEKLKEKEINANWSIIGKGPLKEKLVQQWGEKKNVRFFEPQSTVDVYELLKKQDILVFPSEFEGTPVAILECLANGIVTIANDLPGGIREILKDGIGFRCKHNDLEEFCDKIATLNNDRGLLLKLQIRCHVVANQQYDIVKNSENYFHCFENYIQLKRTKMEFTIINGVDIPRLGGRLDKFWLPNLLVKFIRTVKYTRPI